MRLIVDPRFPARLMFPGLSGAAIVVSRDGQGLGSESFILDWTQHAERAERAVAAGASPGQEDAFSHASREALRGQAWTGPVRRVGEFVGADKPGLGGCMPLMACPPRWAAAFGWPAGTGLAY
jgi:hypothetical protein